MLLCQKIATQGQKCRKILHYIIEDNSGRRHNVLLEKLEVGPFPEYLN